MNAYKKLIEDYSKIDSIGFGRIMNFIFKRLPENEKNLYLVIRDKVSLERLDDITGRDWINSSYNRSDQLIRLAKKWSR